MIECRPMLIFLKTFYLLANIFISNLFPYLKNTVKKQTGFDKKWFCVKISVLLFFC